MLAHVCWKHTAGARGETNYLLDKEKQHASGFRDYDQQIMLDAQEEVSHFYRIYESFSTFLVKIYTIFSCTNWQGRA
jgi:hypothetical protein